MLSKENANVLAILGIDNVYKVLANREFIQNLPYLAEIEILAEFLSHFSMSAFGYKFQSPFREFDWDSNSNAFLASIPVLTAINHDIKP